MASELRARVIRGDPDSDGDEWRALLERAPDAARPEVSIDPFAPAAIAYTSGTTGLPKGAVHSQHNLLLPGAVARATGHRAGYLGGLPPTSPDAFVTGETLSSTGDLAEAAAALESAVEAYGGLEPGADAELQAEFRAAPRSRVVAWLDAGRPDRARQALAEAEQAGLRFPALRGALP